MLIRVVAGTYEGLLYGWEVDVAKAKQQHDQPKASDKKDPAMKLIFGYSAHSECIKSVALNAAKQGKMLLSGSSDEMIKIYNVDKRVEVGTLMEQSGSITCVTFHGATHMLSGSADNTICIWRVSDWNCLHILGGHKGEINAIAIHPSGKLAFSVARDRTLRMWNLVKGRSAYIRRLDFEANLVKMSPQGTRYVLGFGKELNVFNSTNAECVGTLKHSQKIHCAGFLREDHVVCAGEDRHVYIWKVTGELVAKVTHETLKSRIRSLEVVQVDDQWFFVTATSDGMIQIWDAEEFNLDIKSSDNVEDVDQSASVSPIAMTNLGSRKVRLTCLSACNASEPVEARQAAEEVMEQDEEDEPEDVSETKSKGSKRKLQQETTQKPKVAPRVIVEMQEDHAPKDPPAKPPAKSQTKGQPNKKRATNNKRPRRQ